MNYNFKISNCIDLMVANQMLCAHKEELSTQKTERAIAWQMDLISQLETAIDNYNQK